MRRSFIWVWTLAIVGLAGLFLLLVPSSSAGAPSLQASPTPTLQPEPTFYRTVEVPMVRVKNPVNVRQEPGPGAQLIRSAQAGEEFEVRQDTEPVEAGGYTWIPVTVDNQDAWIAQAGFLEQFVVTESVPVEQAEVEAVYASELPERAVEIVVQDDQLQAVDEEGELVAVWNWGEEAGQGQWKAAVIGTFEFEAEELPSFILGEFTSDTPWGETWTEVAITGTIGPNWEMYITNANGERVTLIFSPFVTNGTNFPYVEIPPEGPQRFLNSEYLSDPTGMSMTNVNSLLPKLNAAVGRQFVVTFGIYRSTAPDSNATTLHREQIRRLISGEPLDSGDLPCICSYGVIFLDLQ